MIDREHALSLPRQATLRKPSRGSRCFQARAVPSADLAIIRRIDDLYFDDPFAGCRMLRDLLRGEDVAIGRQQALTMIERTAIEAHCHCPYTWRPAPGHEIYPHLLRSITDERPNQVWAMNITDIPMTRGIVHLAAVVNSFSRWVLAWRLSITMAVAICLEAVEEALAIHGSQFTSAAFTGHLAASAGDPPALPGRQSWFDGCSSPSPDSVREQPRTRMEHRQRTPTEA